MEKLTFNPKTEIPEEPRYWYKEDTLAGKLERHLGATGQIGIGIGDYEGYKKRIITVGPSTGDWRNGSLDMTDRERVYRTVCIKQLSLPALKIVQSWELERMTRFLIREEMAHVAKEKIEPRNLTQKQSEVLYSWCWDRKPKCKTYQGFVVPPCFVYDNGFDGMVYHHLWDEACWYAELNFSFDSKSNDRADSFND